MTEPHRPEDCDAVPPPPGDEGRPTGPPEEVEVALVVAASAYQVIDTEGEAADPDDVIVLLDEEGPSIAVAEPPALAAEAGPGLASSATPEEMMAPVLDAVAGLGVKVDRLQAVVDRELRAESSREKVVDRLHAELQEYKNDLLLKITRPIFVDLIQLHDDMGKMAEALGDERSENLLRDVQQGIEDILYRQGVEPFTSEEETFDPRRQRAVSTVATEDTAQNKRIASRIRVGFAAGEKVIRPELVSVFALKRATPGGQGE